jgi:hypothetical protein
MLHAPLDSLDRPLEWLLSKEPQVQGISLGGTLDRRRRLAAAGGQDGGEGCRASR